VTCPKKFCSTLRN